jgi:hypothetical protein
MGGDVKSRFFSGGIYGIAPSLDRLAYHRLSQPMGAAGSARLWAVDRYAVSIR